MKERLIRERPLCRQVYKQAKELGLSDVQANVLGRRQLTSSNDLSRFYRPKLRQIAPPSLLAGCERATGRIVAAITGNEHIALVTDYDVDGLAAHAVLKRAFVGHFTGFQGRISSFVGSRLQDGYGLTEEMCRRIIQARPHVDLVITADCGTSDEKRLAALKEAGVDVIVTDHHLVPPEDFPASATVLVNPQQQGCDYPDKTIAGCMVAWLVMSSVRSALVERGWLPGDAATLVDLLDYVALATVADSVSLLSVTNRAVVRYGLGEMNRAIRPCWQALYFGTNSRTVLTEEDLAFQVSPRINGASRLDDPMIALQFLLAENGEAAQASFATLTWLNSLRKEKEAAAMEIAHDLVSRQEGQRQIVVYHPDFHAGILGIMASRLTEAYGLPAVVFADGPEEDVLFGSCRSDGEVDIHRVLSTVEELADNTAVGCLLSFGGHQAAAGLKIRKSCLAAFCELLERSVRQTVPDQGAQLFLDTDGTLPAKQISMETVAQLDGLRPFGHHFQPPVFSTEFELVSARYVGKGKDHLQLMLAAGEKQYRAIWFGGRRKNSSAANLSKGDMITCVYQLAINEFRGRRSVQLIVEEVSLLSAERQRWGSEYKAS